MSARPSFTLVLLVAILLVAAGLRFNGINWDSGHGFHPDERSIYLRAGCMYDVLTSAPGYQDCIRDFPNTEAGLPSLGSLFDPDRSPLNPHWFPLGSVLIYVLVFFRFVIELFTDITAMDLRYVGRALSALADVGSVFMVYLLGRRMFSQRVGLLAAGLTALAVVHVQSSHFYRPETFSVFFILFSFWAMLRMLERRRLRDSLLLGLIVGLAMAPKISVLPLAIPLALAYCYRAWDAAGGSRAGVTIAILRNTLHHAVLAGVAAVGVFVLLTPYALLDFATFVADLKAQASMARQAGLWPFTIQYVDTPAFLYQIRQTIVWGLGIPLGVVAWLSIPFAALMVLKKSGPWRFDLLLLAWVVPQFIFLETFEVHFLRYVFPLMPVMILMGAQMLVWLLDYSRTSANRFAHTGAWSSSLSPRVNVMLARSLPKLAVGLIVMVVLSTAFYSLAFQRIYANQHPAIEASRWIQNNVPRGTPIVSDNHWDEFVPGLGAYDVWQFPAYDADNRGKMSALAGRLAKSEYLVFYSYRPYVSVTRDPMRFPFSSSYYRQLFDGGLGYRLERSFTSYPEFLGVSFRDSPYGHGAVSEPPKTSTAVSSERSTWLALNLGYADDNVVGYDHPQVLLFRNVEELPESELQALLIGGYIPTQVAGPVGLLLSEDDKAVQRSGGTWSQLFDRDGWTNRYPVLPWLLAIELIYLVSLPLSMFLFKPLPDRGIVLARVLGLLGVGYVTWLLVSLGWVEFSNAAILLGLLVIAGLSGLVLVFRWSEIKTFIRDNWRLLVLAEVLFLAAFFAFVLIRAANPDLWHPFRGGEKPMELAYLNAVVRSATLPPYDPWYAGGYLNYYYWGYFVLALPIRLTGIIPTTAFNLAVPLFFALTLTGAYSIVYNLAEGVRRAGGKLAANAHEYAGLASQKARWECVLWSPISAGLAAGLFVAVIGNLDGALQLAQGVWGQVFNGVQGLPAFDYWRSSRMIPPLDNLAPSALAFWAPQAIPGLVDVSYHITEFPFFTFLFADLHAHLMVIPFTLLVIGLGLNLVVGIREGGWFWCSAVVVCLGLALGSLWVINSWDYPSYAVLAAVLLGLAMYLERAAPLLRGVLSATLFSAVVGISILAFLPFHQTYETFDAGVAASKWRTPIGSYLAIHGLFLFVVLTFLLVQTHRSLAACFKGRWWSTKVAQTESNAQDGRAWKRVYLLIGFALAVYLMAAGFWTAAMLAALLTLTGLSLWEVLKSGEADRNYRAVPLGLLGMALAIGFGVDFVRLDGDIGRMNTLFKLYLQAWVLFGLAAGFMLWYLGSQGQLRWRWNWTGRAWLGLFTLLLASSLVYTGLGTKARVADRFQDTPLTLDGTAYLDQALHVEEGQALRLASDLEGIQWLQDNVAGSPVVLEAHNEQYHWSARIASYTGLPTVIGWPWHQIQQRSAYSDTIQDRAGHVAKIYSTTNMQKAIDLLNLYEVEFIVIGELERAYYPPEGLAKFQLMVSKRSANLVFENQGMKIYQVLK